MNSIQFIILCAARTGSTMLRHMLNSHPSICCHGEVMAGNIQSLVGLDNRERFPLTVKFEKLRLDNPVIFMQEYVMFGGDMAAVGFKIKYEELVLPEFATIRNALLQNRQIRIIHLLRKNRLNRAISKFTATNIYGIYNISDPAHRPQIEAFILPPDECEEDFITTEFREIEFRKAFSQHSLLEVYYEDLVDPTANAVRQVQDFLGVQPAPLTASTIKINPEQAHDLLKNFVELKRYFTGSRWAMWFK